MTYEEEIKYVLENKQFSKPKIWAILKSIGLFLFSILCLFGSIMIIWAFTQGEIDGFKKIIGSIILLIVTLFYGISILIGLKNEWNADRNFKEFKTSLSTLENFKFITQLLKESFRVRNIELDKENNVVCVVTKTSFLTWSNRITAVCDDARILVNSQSSGNQPFSYGQHKRNIDRIEKEIKNTLANIT